MWIASALETAKTPTIIALGNFDGVHRGHQNVIAPVASFASQIQIEAPIGEPVLTAALGGGLGQSALEAARPLATVVTFYPHPQEFFTGQRRLLLTPVAEKASFLAQIGIEQLVLIPFNLDLANLSPQEFVEQILIERLQAQRISVGQDFRFGHRRQGTIADLQEIAAQYDVPVQVAALCLDGEERISSSAIRLALSQGEVERACELLGRPYSLMGEVVTGQQLGRTIGFPTANLQLPVDKYLPRFGVYSVWVEMPELGQQPGVINIGCRPTVAGQQVTVEVHLLDWSGNLYGQTLTAKLHRFIRPEQKFASLDDLKAQIQRDCDQARAELSFLP